MHKETQRVGERRTRTFEAIEKLLSERQEMLVLYCRMAGLEPFHETGPATDVLEDFCQILVDYMAAGHFEVYQRIADGRERRQPVSDVAQHVYPRLAETTQMLVDFNDKYARAESIELSEDFLQDLSRLGERLATRIELEDQLIDQLRIPLTGVP